MPLTRQLRMYRIEEGRLDDFLHGWVHGVVPLRQRHGFTVESAWTIPDENSFVWIVSYDGPELWADANEAYYASRERQELVPDPSKLIVEQQEWFIEAVPLDPEHTVP